jgi:hypothetical protein
LHFRLRGSSVQIVRSQPDPGTGKARTVPVGSANLETGQLNERAAAALSPEEVREVEAWIAERRSLRMKRCEVAFLGLAEQIGELTEWMRHADETMVDRTMPDVLHAMRELSRAVARRRKPRETVSEP